MMTEISPSTKAKIAESLPPSALSPDALAAFLALADDEFIIGHRHSEWLGLSPFLEEDLTLSSIAQDEFGHARALYRIIWPTWETREQGLVRRPENEWRSCSLTERQSPTWEWSLIRHAIYDTAEPHRWLHLLQTWGSTIDGLDALVANVEEEETFHRRHAHDLVVRIGSANDDARSRLQSAVDELWTDVEKLLSCTTGSESWGSTFLADLDALFTAARLTRPDRQAITPDRPASRPSGADAPDGRDTRHADFASITESLFAVLAFDPKATW